jgi:hypothetical protein
LGWRSIWKSWLGNDRIREHGAFVGVSDLILGDRFVWNDSVWTVQDRRILIQNESESRLIWKVQNETSLSDWKCLELHVRSTPSMKLRMHEEPFDETKSTGIELLDGDLVVLKHRAD